MISIASFFDELEKIAGMGVDLRKKGPAGTKRPDFPTEGSKALAFQQFKTGKLPGEFGVRKPPEPSIRSVSTKVSGFEKEAGSMSVSRLERVLTSLERAGKNTDAVRARLVSKIRRSTRRSLDRQTARALRTRTGKAGFISSSPSLYSPVAGPILPRMPATKKS